MTKEKIKMTSCTQCWQGCEATHTLLVEMLNFKATWENDLVLKNFKGNFPYDPVIPLLGVHAKETKTYAHIKTCI